MRNLGWRWKRNPKEGRGSGWVAKSVSFYSESPPALRGLDEAGYKNAPPAVRVSSEVMRVATGKLITIS